MLKVTDGLSLIHRLLWCLWALVLGSSFLMDADLIQDSNHLKTTLHLSSSVLLVLAACLTVTQVTQVRRLTAIFVAAGMIFGCLGDFAMADLLTFIPNRVMGGMFFFGLGHICYIQATGRYRRLQQMKANSRWWGAVILWQVIGVVLWYGVVFLSEKHLALHYPALIYGSLLAATAGMTNGLSLNQRSFTAVALGAILFLISDGVLAWQIFRDSTPFTRFLVWATYGPGQMLIVYGFASVLTTNRTASNTA